MKQSSLGSRKEDFDVFEILGRGGFARVYRARSLKTDQEVAIKIIDKKMTQHHGMTARVRKEVELHSRLKHPSILELYTFFEDANYVYLVLEMCHNGELQRKIRENGPLTENTVREYLKQILDGLKYLHSYNILHRDLTLANLLLTKDLKVKIADFGLATQLESGVDHFTMCGTPNYISPEVVNRSRQGLESDVWSVGCMMYTMLVGKAPFDTKEIKGTLHRVQSGKFDIPDNLSDHARSLILGLLQTNPDKRLNLQQLSVHPYMQTTKESLSHQEISISDSGIESMSKGYISKEKKHSLIENNTSDQPSHIPYRQSSLQYFKQTRPDSSHCDSIIQNSHNFLDGSKPSHGEILSTKPPCPSHTNKSSSILSFSDCKTNNSKLLSLTNSSSNNMLKFQTDSSDKSIRSMPHSPGSGSDISPLCSKRLRPIRQETRNAILNILEDESICIEFLKNISDDHLKTGKIYEVMCIDCTGRNILIYSPREAFYSQSQGHPVKFKSGDSVSHFKIDALPEKYVKKYQLAKRFVDLVKTKTPIVTLFTKVAKCMLMENDPCPDFEIIYYCDPNDKSETYNNLISKIHFYGQTAQTECVYKDGSCVNIDNKTNFSALSEHLNQSLKYSMKCKDHCTKIVSQMKSISNHSINSSPFPLTIGRRPSSTSDHVPFPYSGLISPADIPPSVVDSLTRQSSLCQSLHSSPSWCSSIDNGTMSTFIPDIGWATQMSNGELNVQFNDGCRLIIVYDANTIVKILWFPCGDSVAQEFTGSNSVPDEVHSKIELLPLFVKRLRSCVLAQKTVAKS